LRDPVVYPPNKSVIIPAGSQGAEISLESSTDGTVVAISAIQRLTRAML